MSNEAILPKLSASFVKFWAWWKRELVSILPETVRNWYFGRGNILIAEIKNNQLRFLRTKAGGLEEIRLLDLTDLPPEEKKTVVRQALAQINGRATHQLALCIPSDQALRKQICLPAAVEENIQQALEFELDRQTPFKPDQVYFDYRIVERRHVERQVIVELVVVVRLIVEHCVEQAASLGLPINAAVFLEDAVEQKPQMNFLPAHTVDKKGRHPRSWLNLGFFGTAVLLLSVSLILPLWQKRNNAIILNSHMEIARLAARQTDLLREQLDSLVAEHNFTTAQKASQLPTLILVNKLSKLLPDDTWISQLEVTGNVIQIQGETGSSSKLMELVENSGVVKEASYKSPLTQIPGTSVERFHISAISIPSHP